MRLYWDSHALFLLGVSPDACRLMRETAEAGHKLLTSPWAVATARSNLHLERQVDINQWKDRLQEFQVVEDHTSDPTLDLPRLLAPLVTAALRAQADRFITGNAAIRDRFTGGSCRGLKILTLGDWLSEFHVIAAIQPADPARPGIVEFSVPFTPKRKSKK